MPNQTLSGSQPALCILSDVHIGADATQMSDYFSPGI